MAKELTCFELIGELDGAMRAVVPEGMDYLVLGGIASSALVNPDTVIDPVEKIIKASPESGDLQLRANGTKRDVDVLITGLTDEEQTARIGLAMDEALGGELVSSVNSFVPHRTWPAPKDRLKATLSRWTSDRTVDDEGVFRYELFPIEQTVSPETYEPWQLITPTGNQVQVLNPLGHILAYRMRSISGLRPKDSEKFTKMANNVMAVPGMREELHDGQFSDWFRFEQAIGRLNAGNLEVSDSVVQIDALPRDLELARIKGKGLHVFETQEWIVKLAQEGPLKKVLDKIIGVK